MTRALHATPDTDDTPLIVHLIERLALLIALAVVIARCTMLEALRDPLEIVPGSDAMPRGAGATAGLVLSLLAIVPALLVLVRRVIDPTFFINRSFAIVGLMLMGGWAVASALWAADAFAALLTAINWLSAMTLAWAVAQLVRTPGRARIVAGVGIGLLLVFTVQGLLYHFNDLPTLQQHAEENRAKILAERGWTEDSFAAQQFFRKINSGEMVGFSASPNTFAALIVVTMILTVGVAIQRARDGESIAWPFVLGVPILLAMLIVAWTHSRTAWATIVLAVIVLTIVECCDRTLRRFARPLYVLGVLGFLGVVAIIVWRGSTTGTLFHDSLTFRWRYWLGAFGVFLEHPFVGVGWDNFGPYYLGHRLPIASEEPRDPHNFIVRGFVELGLVGGLLLIASMGRLIWEVTRPVVTAIAPPLPAAVPSATDPAADGERSLLAVLAGPVTIALAGMALNAMASIDYAQAFDYVDLELRKRLLFALLIAAGIAMATLGRPADASRPTPWLRIAFGVATLLFLLQNLIDFSMFETGGMFLFALIAGSAVAMSGPPVCGASPSLVRRVAPLAAGVVAWLALFFTVVLPVALSESDTVTAGELRRTGRPGAADFYAQAFGRVGYNADYATEAARSLLQDRQYEAFRHWIDRATATNPMSTGAWLLSGRVESQLPAPDVARLRSGYEHALAIDPQNVAARLEYGEQLARLGSSQEAARQIETALAANAGLAPDEPKRLAPDTVAQLERRIAELSGPSSRPAP